ncbi:hypothetical protein ARMGADRAFT_158725 [Armillaria gallica]|uniref:Uncharacterized protein n=1 Tax=Armillaria gallica TaxID=47427 RepID=A0A2H3DAX1_ARMGA|nr:hypothetical protein ARMGADRAFT_158725 [Armillaria gallica]
MSGKPTAHTYATICGLALVALVTLLAQEMSTIFRPFSSDAPQKPNSSYIQSDLSGDRCRSSGRAAQHTCAVHQRAGRYTNGFFYSRCPSGRRRPEERRLDYRWEQDPAFLAAWGACIYSSMSLDLRKRMARSKISRIQSHGSGVILFDTLSQRVLQSKWRRLQLKIRQTECQKR